MSNEAKAGRLITASLGCRTDEADGLVRVDDEHRTSVCGVYADGYPTPRPQLAVVAAGVWGREVSPRLKEQRGTAGWKG